MYIFISSVCNIVFQKNKHQAPKVAKMKQQEYTKVENSKNILDFFFFLEKKAFAKTSLRAIGVLLPSDIRPRSDSPAFAACQGLLSFPVWRSVKRVRATGERGHV